MTIDRWRRIRSRLLHDCRVFRLNEVEFGRNGLETDHPFYVLDAPAWINVIPLMSDDRVVMIRQYRFGTEEETLEIPGGMCDEGESPAEAAHRELLEETGFAAGSLVELGSVHPNPAIQSNRCHSFLATDLRRIADPKPDPNEGFEEELVRLSEVPGLVTGGRITHSLVIGAFYLLNARKD
jgi:8-oxo-dGTP pyrophosphatase MutT (NUDIX family)